MNNKLISIIILSWNRLSYLKETVQNILNKTTIPHELIFSDNNSSEESGIRQYIDNIVGNQYTQDVIKCYNSKNLGVAGGRNMGLKIASGSYLCTSDDDIVVPENWDIKIVEACDKIPKLGITGVNVEPIKFPMQVINGVRVRPKPHGNLGGAFLVLPRRVFKRVGYYRVFGQYGLEDSDMYVRLKQLGLMGAYIEPKGIHLDKDYDKVYRKVKNRAHMKGSSQLKAFAKAKIEYEKTGNVYVPYIEYDPDSPEWQCFESFDGTIQAKADIYDILKQYGIKIAIGNRIALYKDPAVGRSAKLDKAQKQSISRLNKYCLDTGSDQIDVEEQMYHTLKDEFDKNNISYIPHKPT